MEAEGRPAKIRKLSPGVESTATGPTPDKHAIEGDFSSKAGPRAANTGAVGAHDTPQRSSTQGEIPSPPTADDAVESAPRVSLPDSHPLHDLATANPTLSKNQLKKLARQNAWEDARDDRKAKRKVETAAKKARRRAERDENLASAGLTLKDHARQSAAKAFTNKGTTLPIVFLIDCGFDELMRDNERVSLAGQITRAYSDNRRAKYKGTLGIASFTGKLRARFDGILVKNYENWKGFRWSEKGMAELAGEADGWMREKEGGSLAGPFAKYVAGNGDKGAESGKRATVANDEVAEKAGTGEGTVMATTPSNGTAHEHSTVEDASVSEATVGEVIYLSSESPNTLIELKPYSTYIVGGLVDKNREKGICYKRACEAGIKTARLPIGDYLQMQSRKVLATNHVVEIMLKWLEYEDWGKAFVEVMPKRKGGQLKESGTTDATGGGDDVADEVDDEEEDDDADEGADDHVSIPTESGTTRGA